MSERQADAKEDWPPNIQAVFKRMAPASRYLGLEILEADKVARTVKVAFNASDDLCNMWGGIQGGMVGQPKIFAKPDDGPLIGWRGCGDHPGSLARDIPPSTLRICPVIETAADE